MVQFLDLLLPESLYPTGVYPIPFGTSLQSAECPRCGKESASSGWDLRRGFLVKCPHCRILFGRRWNLKSQFRWIFFLFANFLGFFLTLRLRTATILTVVWLSWWVVGSYLEDNRVLPPWAELPYFAIGFFGPWLVNIVVSIRHEIDLDKADAEWAALVLETPNVETASPVA